MIHGSTSIRNLGVHGYPSGWFKIFHRNHRIVNQWSDGQDSWFSSIDDSDSSINGSRSYRIAGSEPHIIIRPGRLVPLSYARRDRDLCSIISANPYLRSPWRFNCFITRDPICSKVSVWELWTIMTFDPQKSVDSWVPDIHAFLPWSPDCAERMQVWCGRYYAMYILVFVPLRISFLYQGFLRRVIRNGRRFVSIGSLIHVIDGFRRTFLLSFDFHECIYMGSTWPY